MTDRERNKYQHLRVVGKIAHSIPYKKGDIFKFVEAPVFDWLKEQPDFEDLLALADHRVVQPKEINIKKAIGKIDAPRVHPGESDPDYKIAMRCAVAMLSQALTAEPGEMGEFNLDAGPGLTYKKHGLPTKGEAMESELFDKRWDNFATPLWENCGKVEFLPMDEILDNKIRTFKNCEVDFIARQKQLYNNQNEQFYKMCKNPLFWARYGFVKEYGGFHEMIKRLESFRIRLMLDVSGWDRKLSVMKEVYQIRNLFLKNKDKYPWLKWLVYHTVRSLEVDEAGIVFENHGGNRSGSANTTVDNCIGHIIILAYALARTYRLIHGKPISDKLLIEQGVNIMGDDNLSGLTDEFLHPELERFITESYAKWGLELKPGSVFFTTEGGPVHPTFEFLGCKVGFNELYGKYVPIPRINKVCSTILYSEKDTPLNIYAQRVIGLTYLSYAVPFLMRNLTSLMEHLCSNYAHALDDHLIVEMSMLIGLGNYPTTRVYGFEKH